MPKTHGDLVDQAVIPGEQALERWHTVQHHYTMPFLTLISRVGENTRGRGTGFLSFASHNPRLSCALVSQARGGNLF